MVDDVAAAEQRGQLLYIRTIPYGRRCRCSTFVRAFCSTMAAAETPPRSLQQIASSMNPTNESPDNSYAPAIAIPAIDPNDTRPTLIKDKSFWGLAVTQFLGAFNDNLYKQLVLLLAVPVGAAAVLNGQEQKGADLQGWALFLFSIPFVLWSGFAGYLSDRFSKQPIIWMCKVAEIGISLLALAAFLCYDWSGMIGTWTVLFLIGTHSAFFGPGKYGILPELFRTRDLATANGIILMSTFLAIIFGTEPPEPCSTGWLARPERLTISGSARWFALASPSSVPSQPVSFDAHQQLCLICL